MSRKIKGKGRGLLQNVHATELARAGEARQAALDQAEAELERIAEILPSATSAGLSLSEISRITGVSRPTLYDLRRRSGGTPDADLEVLATLAADGPLREGDLMEATGESVGRIRTALERHDSKGWVERVEGATGTVFSLTSDGRKALDEWDFGSRFDERTTKTLRVALSVMRFTPEERADVERKIAQAEAQGRERLGFLEAFLMGVQNELARRQKADTA
jgi:DNA-binding MarR family transcriptional regulator